MSECLTLLGDACCWSVEQNFLSRAECHTAVLFRLGATTPFSLKETESSSSRVWYSIPDDPPRFPGLTESSRRCRRRRLSRRCRRRPLLLPRLRLRLRLCRRRRLGLRRSMVFLDASASLSVALKLPASGPVPFDGHASIQRGESGNFKRIAFLRAWLGILRDLTRQLLSNCRQT